jgi:hypothetical protein
MIKEAWFGFLYEIRGVFYLCKEVSKAVPFVKQYADTFIRWSGFILVWLGPFSNIDALVG